VDQDRADPDRDPAKVARVGPEDPGDRAAPEDRVAPAARAVPEARAPTDPAGAPRRTNSVTNCELCSGW